MKLTQGLGTGINPDTGASITTTPPTIRNNYDSYNLVPSNYTLVASRDSSTNMTVDTNASGSYFTTTYDIYAASFQPPGTYTGKVKYLIIHPSNNTITNNVEGAFASAGKEKIYYDEHGNGPYFAMQDMTTDICNSITIYDEASQTQLVDIRDGKTYWIAKLKDGHCWMTQNLDLDLDSAKPLTSDDTDLIDHSLTGAYADGYIYDTVNNILYWTPANSTNTWANSNDYPYSKDRGKFYPEGAPAEETINDYHRLNGNYYNWTAAIASNYSNSLQSDTYTNINANPQNSICPKGWRLPTSSSVAEYNEFSKLASLYGNTSAKMRAEPIWFVRSGMFKGQINYSGADGYYWSSTISGASNAYKLAFGGNWIYPDNNSYNTGRYFGYSVRCLAR